MLSRYAPTSIDAFEDKRDILRTLIRMDMLHILIIGGPGTGKSALSRLLVREYYAGAPNVKYFTPHLYWHLVHAPFVVMAPVHRGSEGLRLPLALSRSFSRSRACS